MTSSDQKYDIKFREITSLNWKPWVGAKYDDLTDQKLLIVGESHYCWKVNGKMQDEVNCKGFTRSMIHSSGLFGLAKTKEREPRHRLLRNIEKTLYNNKSITQAQSFRLWSSVSFYNFIQTPMVSALDRPKLTDWSLGWKTFFNVIDVLQPTHILFCGVSALNKKALFEAALKINKYKYDKGIVNRAEKISGTYTKTKGIISKCDYKLSISCIRHPSKSFSSRLWGKVIKSQMPEYIDWLNKPGQ